MRRAWRKQGRAPVHLAGITAAGGRRGTFAADETEFRGGREEVLPSAAGPDYRHVACFGPDREQYGYSHALSRVSYMYVSPGAMRKRTWL